MDGINLAALLLGLPETPKSQEPAKTSASGQTPADFLKLFLDIVPQGEPKAAEPKMLELNGGVEPEKMKKSEEKPELDLQAPSIPLLTIMPLVQAETEKAPEEKVDQSPQATQLQNTKIGNALINILAPVIPEGHIPLSKQKEIDFSITRQIPGNSKPPNEALTTPEFVPNTQVSDQHYSESAQIQVQRAPRREITNLMLREEKNNANLPEKLPNMRAEHAFTSSSSSTREIKPGFEEIREPKEKLQNNELKPLPDSGQFKQMNSAPLELPHAQIDAEQPQSQQVDRPVLNKQIVDHIIARSQVIRERESTTITIQLKPEHLGRLEIVLRVENGILQGEIKVMDNLVRQSIEADLSQLKHSLADQGLKLAQITVSDLQNGVFQQFQQESRERQQAFARPNLRRPYRQAFQEELERVELAEISLSQINYKA